MEPTRLALAIVQFIHEAKYSWTTTHEEMADELAAILQHPHRLEAYAEAFKRRDYHNEGDDATGLLLLALDQGADPAEILDACEDTQERLDLLDLYGEKYGDDAANDLARHGGYELLADAREDHARSNDESDDE